VANEIRTIHPDSPRLKALLRGNVFALQTHKFHLLRWAELESKALAAGAREIDDPGIRADYTKRAKGTLKLALSHYPEEPALLASVELLDELLLGITVSELMREAENAAASGGREDAIVIYNRALSYLQTEGNPESIVEIAERIKNALSILGNR